MVIDTPKNTKIVYLYVRDFRWNRTVDHESSMGHPKKGCIYQAVKNIDTKSYRLAYEFDKNENTKDFQFILLNKLVHKASPLTQESPSFYVTGTDYDSDIFEVNMSNLLDCDLNDKELDKLYQWVMDDNKTLNAWAKAFFEKAFGGTKQPPLTPHSSSGPPTPMTKKEFRAELVAFLKRTGDTEMASVVSTLTELHEKTPILYSAVGRVVHEILSTAENDTSIQDLRLDDQLGPGANVASAVEKLMIYGGKNRRTNFHSETLVAAIKDLLLELFRINKTK